VALSLSADAGEIARVIEEAAPDIIHVGAAAERFGAAESQALKRRYPGVALMRSIPVVDDSSVAFAAAHEGIADFLLLDSHAPGDAQIGALGRTHDWRISRRIVESVAIPAILAGGLGPDNVREAIRDVGPAGVDSKTKTNRAGARAKDLEKVRAFVRAARAPASARTT
jgi:phosphoribosylanthranilate isomerase